MTTPPWRPQRPLLFRDRARTRRWVACAITLALQASLVGAANDGAEDAVASALAVERALLEEELGRHTAASRDRGEVDTRLGQLYQAIDAALRQREQPGFTERIDQLRSDIDRAEGERTGLLAGERLVLDRIRERLRRINLYEQELDRIQRRHEERIAAVLDGTWDIALMPVDQHGTCVLRQEGTIVSGTYQLDGGFSGSLQGTLVNRKLVLHRIDSRLGKSMELEGYLAADGRTIRGTWLSYELAGREGGTGQWIAERRARTEPAPPPGP